MLEIKQSIKEFREFENKFKEFSEELKSVRREYITILGVFAAIILGFVGSFTFTSSMFESLNKANLKTIMVSGCIGALLIGNILFVLFETIKYINYKEESKVFWKAYLVYTIAFILILGITFI